MQLGLLSKVHSVNIKLFKILKIVFKRVVIFRLTLLIFMLSFWPAQRLTLKLADKIFKVHGLHMPID